MDTILTYTYYDNCYSDTYSRQSIDGSMVGCSRCVGYCQFDGHKGFLTSKQREIHNCIRKACFYYLPKQKNKRKNNRIEDKKSNAELGRCITTMLSGFEGLRPMRVEQDPKGIYLIKYITITNAYAIPEIEQEISKALGKAVKMIKLNYDFDHVVQLLLA